MIFNSKIIFEEYLKSKLRSRDFFRPINRVLPNTDEPFSAFFSECNFEFNIKNLFFIFILSIGYKNVTLYDLIINSHKLYGYQ